MSVAFVTTRSKPSGGGCERALARETPETGPKHRPFTEGWQLGMPDLVLTLPEPYTLRAQGEDVFRLFVMPIDLTSTRYVRP